MLNKCLMETVKGVFAVMPNPQVYTVYMRTSVIGALPRKRIFST